MLQRISVPPNSFRTHGASKVLMCGCLELGNVHFCCIYWYCLKIEGQKSNAWYLNKSTFFCIKHNSFLVTHWVLALICHVFVIWFMSISIYAFPFMKLKTKQNRLSHRNYESLLYSDVSTLDSSMYPDVESYLNVLTTAHMDLIYIWV